MWIVIEGPDNSGKSTLADQLGAILSWPVVKSEGREKFAGEMDARVERYHSMEGDIIFDRHPVVSQGIYSLIRQNTPVSQALIERFYQQDILFIYCRPDIGRGMRGHVQKDYDEDQYLIDIEENYEDLVQAYDQWAASHANLIYRIGDDVPLLCSFVMQYVKRFSPYRDIQAFHKKFQLEYSGKPRVLEPDLFDFRYKFLCEELREWHDATILAQERLSRGHTEDLPRLLELQLDGLVDLVYVALGTAYLQGFDFEEAWNRVQAANMAKVRAERASDSKRGSTFDVVKPRGWIAPSHIDLVRDNAHAQ